MCQFLSLVSDGQGHIYYFDHAARKDKVTDKRGHAYRYDSHASIADYYGLDEDACNKWEYNPYADKLVLDMRNTQDDMGAVRRSIDALDLSDLCGNYKAVRELLAEIKTMSWVDNHGPVPDGVQMYDTRNAARNAVWNAAVDAAVDAAGAAAVDAVWNAARNAAGAAVRNADVDAALLARLLVVDDLVDRKHLDHARLRWSVHQAGYGVLCDVKGVLYCYRRVL